jgi:hypothetical protein
MVPDDEGVFVGDGMKLITPIKVGYWVVTERPLLAQNGRSRAMWLKQRTDACRFLD